MPCERLVRQDGGNKDQKLGSWKLGETLTDYVFQGLRWEEIVGLNYRIQGHFSTITNSSGSAPRQSNRTSII